MPPRAAAARFGAVTDPFALAGLDEYVVYDDPSYYDDGFGFEFGFDLF